jgi:hypothetical protein
MIKILVRLISSKYRRAEKKFAYLESIDDRQLPQQAQMPHIQEKIKYNNVMRNEWQNAIGMIFSGFLALSLSGIGYCLFKIVQLAFFK